MTSINFKANYIKPTYIKDSQKNKQEASFVELDITDRNDMKALKKTTENWQDSLADFIYEDSKDAYLWKLGGRHIYAVTKQKDNFENLDYNKILGLAELSEAYKLNELEILQVNPEATYSTQQKRIFRCRNRYFRHIKRLVPDKTDEGQICITCS